MLTKQINRHDIIYIFMTNKVLLFLLELLFPIRCISCGKYKQWICDDCLKNIELNNEHPCPRCEKNSTVSGITCPNCHKNFPLDGMISAVSYKNSLVSEAVHLLKYRFIKDLTINLSELMTKAYINSNNPLPDIIIPVPLHKRRLRWRGFNQAELLAEYLSNNLAPGISIATDNSIILRKKYSKPQAKIKNYQDRIANMQDVFGSSSNISLDNKHALLVDDIATTGTTIIECAKVLKKLHARKVTALVISRQELGSD